jgi:hypothetical protein
LGSFPQRGDATPEGYTSYPCKNAAEFLLPLLTHIRESDDDVLDLRVESASIEDIFLEVAKGA